MIVLLNDILEIALQMLLNDVEIEIKMPLSSQLQPSIWRSSSSPKEGKRAKFNDDILNLVSPSLIIKWFVIILHMVARKRHNSCESSRMIQLNRITIAFWVKWNWLSKQFDSAILWDIKCGWSKIKITQIKWILKYKMKTLHEERYNMVV